MTELDIGPPGLECDQNSLLTRSEGTAHTADQIPEPLTFASSNNQRRRLLENQLRTATATEALARLDQETQIFGLTGGKFSKIELIQAALAKTGPADLTLSSWTAARADALALHELKTAGAIRAARLIFDFTFARRDPAAAHLIRQSFGPDSIALSVIHSKFVLLGNDSWRLVIRTSMNLNLNPRTEDFHAAHDPPLFDFLTSFADAIFARPTIADTAAAASHRAKFKRICNDGPGC